MDAQKSMKKPQWRATALAIAAAVFLGVSASDASALALGRVTVQSALGEPLRVDIDVPEITTEEAASLRTKIASPETFRAAGLEYNSAILNIDIALQRRLDGRYFLQLSSPRPINDPFVDLILEVNWSSGHIVRDYTMLFDPPNLRPNETSAATRVSPVTPTAAEPLAPVPLAPPPPVLQPVTRTVAERAPAASQAISSKPVTDESRQVTVQNGDTAGKIALARKPASVSLDQMLLALLHANPEAFVGGNVNRLKVGAVLDVPSAEDAGSVTSSQARQTLVAQSRDFNEFRRRLAQGLPAARIGSDSRRAAGKIQAHVEDRKPVQAIPDKLTLSKGAVQGKANEDRIARDRAAQDSAARVAELKKNINDLNKITASPPAASSSSASPAAGGPSTAKPGVALPLSAPSAAKATSSVAPAPSRPPAVVPVAPASATTVTPAPVVPAVTPMPTSAAFVSATTAAATATATASVDSQLATALAMLAASTPDSNAAAATASASAAQSPASAAIFSSVAKPAAVTTSKPRPTALRSPETSLLDDLLENPIVPATAGGVLALLLGLGFYRARQRKKTTQVDSSFLESRLQPDSFFGASGGQRVDTNEENQIGSSLVYSPSQLDAAGDVDPVAEADVYLAYGRDLQAEEILKEAMRTTPQRVAIQSKLLEIYAKRRDGKAFELVATEAYGLTRGIGPEWEHICLLGQELDPSNPLYQPGGQPVHGATMASGKFGASTQILPVTEPASGTTDVDLDLDFSIGEEDMLAAAPVAQRAVVATSVSPAVEPAVSLNMDFQSPATRSATVKLELAATSPNESARLDAFAMTLTENSLSAAGSAKAAPSHPVASLAGTPATDSGMIEFDIGALSLDLEAEPVASPKASTSKTAPPKAAPAHVNENALAKTGAPLSTIDAGNDPLVTKLALAEEFNAIGDPDGARSLAQEVLAEASGDLKSKAQRFLAEIG